MLNLILNERFILYLFIILALLTPAGVGVYFLLMRGKNLSPVMRLWLIAVAIAGPLNLILWIVYNAIENVFGLDSVVALLINLALFLAVAVIAGIILSRLYIRFYLAASRTEHPNDSHYKPDQNT